MSIRDDLSELAKKAAAGKVSSQEFDILQIQILSSMYQENKYREDKRKLDHKELSDKIDRVIKHQEMSIKTRAEMQKTLDRHELYIRGMGVVMVMILGWIIPSALDRLFGV